MLQFNALAGGDPRSNIRINFTSSEVRMTVLPDTEDHIFIRLDKTPERGGRTDRQTDGRTDRSAVAVTAVCITSIVDAL